jgi:hypothetical protein
VSLGVQRLCLDSAFEVGVFFQRPKPSVSCQRSRGSGLGDDAIEGGVGLLGERSGHCHGMGRVPGVEGAGVVDGGRRQVVADRKG